jgi:hypothetical protein
MGGWCLAILMIVLVACPQAVPVVGPSADLIACVTTAALKGESVAQIATTCGSDVLSVLEALLASKDPTVQASNAFHEATSTKARLSHD